MKSLFKGNNKPEEIEVQNKRQNQITTFAGNSLANFQQKITEETDNVSRTDTVQVVVGREKVYIGSSLYSGGTDYIQRILAKKQKFISFR